MGRQIALVLALALLVRLGAFWMTQETRLVSDELAYYYQAASLVEGRQVLGEGRRPPGSIWYYAAVLRVLGVSPPAARLGNVLAGCVTVWIVWLLGRRFGGPRVGLGAALVTALYPTMVLHASTLWSESIYTPLALGALALLPSSEHRLDAVRLVAAGFLLGAAALTREVGVFWLATVLLAVLAAGGFRSAAAWGRAALLGLAAGAIVVPWTVRQTRDDGPFALISRTGWMNLYVGNAPIQAQARDPWAQGVGRALYRSYRSLGTTAEERDAAAREIALEAILDRLPWWPFEKMGETLPRLLTPNSVPTGRLLGREGDRGWAGNWAYRTRVDGTPLEGLRDVVAYGSVLAWGAVLLGGSAGLTLAGRRPGAALLALFIAAHVIPVLVTFAAARFRLPFVPVLGIGASWLAVRGGAAWQEAPRSRRILAAFAVTAVLVGFLWRWNTVLEPQWG